MATISGEVSKKVLQEEGEGSSSEGSNWVPPSGIDGLIFSYVLDESHLPDLFSDTQNSDLAPSLYSGVNSFLQTWAADSKEKKETLEQTKILQESIRSYYTAELQKTKPKGVELSQEEQARMLQYSNCFCAYLTSERMIQECNASNAKILEILSLFSFRNLEAFFAPSAARAADRVTLSALGRSDKFQYLELLYSKGINHQELENLIPLYERQHGYQSYFYALEDLPLADRSYEEILFLLQLPQSILRHQQNTLYRNSATNAELNELLKLIISLLKTGKITVPQLQEHWKKLDPNTLERMQKGEMTVEELIQKSNKPEYSIYQRSLINELRYTPRLALSLTDEQAFVVLSAYHGRHMYNMSVTATPNAINELRKISLNFSSYNSGQEGNYRFSRTLELITCLNQGVSAEYFNRPTVNLSDRINSVFLGLKAGLSLAQVTHPNFSLNAFPDHGMSVLKVLSQGKYEFDQLMSFPRQKVLALAAGISEEIADDKQFHEAYVDFLTEKNPWEKLKKISLDKLIFIRRRNCSQPLEVYEQDPAFFSFFKSDFVQKKVIDFPLPLELIDHFSLAQLSFIYWEDFRFLQTPMSENVHFNLSYKERYSIAKQCTDFDIECLCRLNITLEQLRQYPHIRVEHIQAVEEGYSKVEVLACKTVAEIEKLRNEQGRPKPVILEPDIENAFEAFERGLETTAKLQGPKTGENRHVEVVCLPDRSERYEVNVPSDGTCLFYSAAFAYLLPVVTDPAKFKERFIKLFGEEVAGSMEDNRKLLLEFDGNPHFIRDRAPVFEVLINDNFRKRLVAFMRENSKVLGESIQTESETFEQRMDRMENPARKAWGDQLEIEAMSQFLEMRITVCQHEQEKEKEFKAFKEEVISKPGADHGQGYAGRMYLVHTTADPSVPMGNNHYHYLIDKACLSLAGADEKEKKESREIVNVKDRNLSGEFQSITTKLTVSAAPSNVGDLHSSQQQKTDSHQPLRFSPPPTTDNTGIGTDPSCRLKNLGPLTLLG